MNWRDIIIYTQKTKPLQLLFLVSHNIYYFDFYFTKNIGYLYQRYGGRYYYATSMYFEYTGSNP